MGSLPPRRRLGALLLGLWLTGCGPQPAEQQSPELSAGVDALIAGPEVSPSWRSMPAEGVTLEAGDGVLLVNTGPHAVLWPAAAEPVGPPYAVTAVLHKRSGRLHEGYGLVFGGEALDTEGEQQYSYFLIRGDGSYLIRMRQGAAVPVLRGWTSHPAILRDTDSGGRPNELRVHVGESDVVFVVNGVEVDRLPAEKLRTRGVAGVRLAHDVRLAITGFRTGTEQPSNTTQP